jgi:hypothetical protein
VPVERKKLVKREALKRGPIRFLIPFLLFLLLAASYGCLATSSQQHRNEKPDPYEGIFTQKCTACHDLTLVEEAHTMKTNTEMREILKRHKDKQGSEITEQDLKTLLELYE